MKYTGFIASIAIAVALVAFILPNIYAGTPGTVTFTSTPTLTASYQQNTQSVYVSGTGYTSDVGVAAVCNGNVELGTSTLATQSNGNIGLVITVAGYQGDTCYVEAQGTGSVLAQSGTFTVSSTASGMQVSAVYDSGTESVIASASGLSLASGSSVDAELVCGGKNIISGSTQVLSGGYAQDIQLPVSGSAVTNGESCNVQLNDANGNKLGTSSSVVISGLSSTGAAAVTVSYNPTLQQVTVTGNNFNPSWQTVDLVLSCNSNYVTQSTADINNAGAITDASTGAVGVVISTSGTSNGDTCIVTATIPAVSFPSNPFTISNIGGAGPQITATWDQIDQWAQVSGSGLPSGSSVSLELVCNNPPSDLNLDNPLSDSVISVTVQADGQITDQQVSSSQTSAGDTCEVQAYTSSSSG